MASTSSHSTARQVDQLIPVWLDNGVNTMFPIEVGARVQHRAWRETHGPELRGSAAPTRSFTRDYAAVDAEVNVSKLVGWAAIPRPDHRLAPDSKWENAYYCDTMCCLRLTAVGLWPPINSTRRPNEQEAYERGNLSPRRTAQQLRRGGRVCAWALLTWWHRVRSCSCTRRVRQHALPHLLLHNGYGYHRPLAWLARRNGYKLMGIVDFDVPTPSTSSSPRAIGWRSAAVPGWNTRFRTRVRRP